MVKSGAGADASLTAEKGRDTLSLRVAEIKQLLKTLEEQAHAAHVEETHSAGERGISQIIKTVLRRLLRPIWERQTSYNLANAHLGTKFSELWLETQEQQSNLYLRSLQLGEEKLNGLLRLIDEELSTRDQLIDDLDKRLRRIEARDAQE